MEAVGSGNRDSTLLRAKLPRSGYGACPVKRRSKKGIKKTPLRENARKVSNKKCAQYPSVNFRNSLKLCKIRTSAIFGRYGKVAAPHIQKATAWSAYKPPVPKPPLISMR